MIKMGKIRKKTIPYRERRDKSEMHGIIKMSTKFWKSVAKTEIDYRKQGPIIENEKRLNNEKQKRPNTKK